jgi:2-acylglycerol O-acyltransferase 2
MATVVLSRTLTPPTRPTKNDPTQAYLNKLWMNFIGNISSIVVISFVFIPCAFTSFMFLYYGILHGIAFVMVVCAYNHLESKYHPLGETGRRWEAFIRLIGYLWEPFARMKPVTVVKLAADSFYSPHRKYMFCFHPHGILFLGPATVVFNIEKYLPGLKVNHLMSTSCFIAPMFRQFCIWIGGIPVTKEAAREAASKGNSLSLVPGGLAEMLLADPRPRLLDKVELEKAISFETKANTVGEPGETKKELSNSRPRKTVALYLQNRKGFVRLAVELGLDLVPVFTFGELENYHQMRLGLRWRMKVSRMIKIPLIFLYGKFGLIPFSEPMAVVFGKPIRTEQDTNPSAAVIDFYHRKYLEALGAIFEENKAKYGHADTRLIFM